MFPRTWATSDSRRGCRTSVGIVENVSERHWQALDVLAAALPAVSVACITCCAPGPRAMRRCISGRTSARMRPRSFRRGGIGMLGRDRREGRCEQTESVRPAVTFERRELAVATQ